MTRRPHCRERCPPDERRANRELWPEYGLNEPMAQQYLRYLGRLARGDLGQSYRYSGGQSVAEGGGQPAGLDLPAGFFQPATCYSHRIRSGDVGSLESGASWRFGSAGLVVWVALHASILDCHDLSPSSQSLCVSSPVATPIRSPAQPVLPECWMSLTMPSCRSLY